MYIIYVYMGAPFRCFGNLPVLQVFGGMTCSSLFQEARLTILALNLRNSNTIQYTAHSCLSSGSVYVYYFSMQALLYYRCTTMAARLHSIFHSIFSPEHQKASVRHHRWSVVHLIDDFRRLLLHLLPRVFSHASQLSPHIYTRYKHLIYEYVICIYIYIIYTYIYIYYILIYMCASYYT